MAHKVKPEVGNLAEIDYCGETIVVTVLAYDKYDDAAVLLKEEDADRFGGYALEILIGKSTLKNEVDSNLEGRWMWVLRETVSSTRFLKDLGSGALRPTASALVQRFPDGLKCCLCKKFFDMAVPNAPDGSDRLICFTCRGTKMWKFTPLAQW
jgi:hypothetical protein